MARDKRRSGAARPVRAETLIGALPRGRVLDSAGVHQVRRRIKHVRAVLKLADDAGAAGAERVRAALGAVTKRIAPMRDAAVAVRQAAKWVQKPQNRFDEIVTALTAEPEPRHPARWWIGWWREFDRACRALDDVGRRTSAEDLRDALKRSVRRAGKRRRRARPSDVERLHRWRKAVIALREQIDFLRPVLGAKADRLYDGLDSLGKRLGRVTDAQVLIAAVEKYRWPEEQAKTAEKFVEHLRKKQRRAAREACREWPEVATRLKRACD